VPYITHLHGTELKFFDYLLKRDPQAGLDWLHLMTTWAQGSAAVVCASQDLARKALDLLGLRPELVVHLPQGVDPTLFAPRRGPNQLSTADWLEWLVDHPRGWDSSGKVGSIRYHTDQVLGDFTPEQDRGFAIFVGRYLAFKGLPVLLQAYRRARVEHGVTAPLVIWGGSPGEWDGEHPFDLAQRLASEGVYFVG
jgi:glycosyltransferase involved in cell wall biosynthesis